MKVNLELLEEKISDRGMTIEKFSEKIGINSSTYYRKKEKGGLTFSVGQMHDIVNVLNLSMKDARNIFLD